MIRTFHILVGYAKFCDLLLIKRNGQWRQQQPLHTFTAYAIGIVLAIDIDIRTTTAVDFNTQLVHVKIILHSDHSIS